MEDPHEASLPIFNSTFLRGEGIERSLLNLLLETSTNRPVIIQSARKRDH